MAINDDSASLITLLQCRASRCVISWRRRDASETAAAGGMPYNDRDLHRRVLTNNFSGDEDTMARGSLI